MGNFLKNLIANAAINVSAIGGNGKRTRRAASQWRWGR